MLIVCLGLDKFLMKLEYLSPEILTSPTSNISISRYLVLLIYLYNQLSRHHHLFVPGVVSRPSLGRPGELFCFGE